MYGVLLSLKQFFMDFFRKRFQPTEEKSTSSEIKNAESKAQSTTNETPVEKEPKFLSKGRQLGELFDRAEKRGYPKISGPILRILRNEILMDHVKNGNLNLEENFYEKPYTPQEQKLIDKVASIVRGSPNQKLTIYSSPDHGEDAEKIRLERINTLVDQEFTAKYTALTKKLLTDTEELNKRENIDHEMKKWGEQLYDAFNSNNDYRSLITDQKLNELNETNVQYSTIRELNELAQDVGINFYHFTRNDSKKIILTPNLIIDKLEKAYYARLWELQETRDNEGFRNLARGSYYDDIQAFEKQLIPLSQSIEKYLNLERTKQDKYQDLAVYARGNYGGSDKDADGRRHEALMKIVKEINTLNDAMKNVKKEEVDKLFEDINMFSKHYNLGVEFSAQELYPSLHPDIIIKEFEQSYHARLWELTNKLDEQ